MKRGQTKENAQAQEAVRTHRNYNHFESEVSVEKSRVQLSPSLENSQRDVFVLWLMLRTRTPSDETLGNMRYSFDALNCLLFVHHFSQL